MTSEATGGAGRGVRRIVQACLMAQIAVAVLLAVQAWEPQPATDWRPPVAAPGEQRRPYDPGMMPPRPQDGTGVELPAQPPSALTITQQATGGDGTHLLLAGTLAPGDAARVAEALATAAPPVTVALHSPGGSVSAALDLGRLLRSREIATEVPAGAACLSACPFAFAGGAARTVSPDGWLGVHQSYFDQSAIMPAFVAVERIQFGEAQVMRYLHAMGVDPMVMVHALETPSDDIYLLSAAELDRYALVTDEDDAAASTDD